MVTKQPADAPPAAAPNLSRNPGFLIRRLQQVAVAIFAKSLTEHGLTPVQYTILSVLKGNPGIDQATLAARAVLDTSTVMDVVRRLLSRDLIRRVAGTKDRRTRLVSLTPEGEALLAAVEPLVEESRTRLLQPLDPQEYRAFLELIAKVLGAHEQGPDSAPPHRPWRRLAASKGNGGRPRNDSETA